MPISFTRAPTVAPGDPITSTQIDGLALAFNDRLRSGLGDPTWRIAFYLFGLFRQIRNPDSSGTLFPPQDEFFSIYQGISPSDAQWPSAGGGLPEGTNVANPLGAFVFGAAAIKLSEEIDRISGFPVSINGRKPATNADWWQLAKMQRGAVDPDTSATSSPALDIAREHLRIAYNIRSPFGNSYGGYLPIPNIVAPDCNDPGGGIPRPPDYEVFFTRLRDGVVTTFPGSCPDADKPAHVNRVLQIGPNWVVVLNSGAVKYFPTKDYIQGPYTGGGSLRKDTGQQLSRAINHYVSDFRGTQDQRDTGEWNSAAFDFQRFLVSQYHLAPNRGQQIGNTLSVIYPHFDFAGKQDRGTLSKTHPYAPGFKIASCYVGAIKATGPYKVEITNGVDVIHSFTVKPDALGNVDHLQMLPVAVAPGFVRIRLPDGFDCTAGGAMTIECTELFPYKPEAHDIYLLLRVASATASGGAPGSGLEFDKAKETGDIYFANGALNAGPGFDPQPDDINSNAVFDAARRMSKYVRIIDRQQFIGYEVANGRSILYFRRYPLGLSGSSPSDIFEGIAGGRFAVTKIEEALSYTVRTGTITYASVNYAAGQAFNGIKGIATFEGSGIVYERNAIRAVAAPGKFTNEWLCGVSLNVYHTSESSIWKPTAYSDYFTFSERCHFYHGNYNAALKMQFDYGQTLSLAPESPTGYRYADGTNIVDCAGVAACLVDNKNRYNSCRLYEPDVEIESAETIIESGDEIVKVTMTGRVHFYASAPASISRDVTTWVAANIRGEPYRTTENALREYLLWTNRGTNAVVGKIGDAAAGSSVWALADNPFGAVFPHFYLTKLIPRPYDDGNDDQNEVDSPLIHDTLKQAELYLRCMCEGYVDGITSEKYACTNNIASVYDYTFANLCFDAFKGQWISPIAGKANAETSGNDIREDYPQSFGVLPNTVASSEIFNQYARAINLMDKVRVMLPFKFETQNLTDADLTFYRDATNANGSPADCGAFGSGSGVVYRYDIPAKTATTAAAWAGGTEAISNIYAGFLTGPSIAANCSGTKFGFSEHRDDQKYRYTLLDPDAQYACPPAWRDMLADSGVMIFSVTDVIDYTVSSIVAAGSGSTCAGVEVWAVDGSHSLLFTDPDPNHNSCKILPATGTCSADALLPAAIYAGRGGITDCSEDTSYIHKITPIVADAYILRIPLH